MRVTFDIGYDELEDPENLVDTVVESVVNVIDPNCDPDRGCLREWSASASDVTEEYREDEFDVMFTPAIVENAEWN